MFRLCLISKLSLDCGGRDLIMYLLVEVIQVVLETGSCTYLWGDGDRDRNWTM